MKTEKQLTAVEQLEKQILDNWMGILTGKVNIGDFFEQAKEMEEKQSELYAEFAVLNDRSKNPIIPFNEFINIDNL
jgi:hypothetical protein